MRSVSFIIRARDEAASIGRCLELVRAQQVDGEPPELIVVDSGSRDVTIEIARRQGARIVQMPAAEFTFGRALNLGASEARGEILVALSAHAFLPDTGWLSRLLAVFGDEQVACASGERYRPDGSRLELPVRLDESVPRRHPSWGYSNAAGGFRAALWRERPFREDLPGCEDKEWALHWLGRGYVCRLDPELVVEHDHTHDPVRSIYLRSRREAEGLVMALAGLEGGGGAVRGGRGGAAGGEAGSATGGGGAATAATAAAGAGGVPDGVAELVRRWWSDLRFYDSPLRARLSHRRAARLLGEYAGRRRGARHAAGDPSRGG